MINIHKEISYKVLNIANYRVAEIKDVQTGCDATAEYIDFIALKITTTIKTASCFGLFNEKWKNKEDYNGTAYRYNIIQEKSSYRSGDDRWYMKNDGSSCEHSVSSALCAYVIMLNDPIEQIKE